MGATTSLTSFGWWSEENTTLSEILLLEGGERRDEVLLGPSRGVSSMEAPGVVAFDFSRSDEDSTSYDHHHRLCHGSKQTQRLLSSEIVGQDRNCSSSDTCGLGNTSSVPGYLTPLVAEKPLASLLMMGRGPSTGFHAGHHDGEWEQSRTDSLQASCLLIGRPLYRQSML